MNASANEQSYGGPEQEIFKHAFSDPIIENEMLYPALTTLDDIYEANATLLMPVEHFFTAYENLQIESAEPLVLDGGATHLLRVTYTLGGATYHGYAYAPAAPQTDRPASLIIPGSGLNCSEPIYRKDPASYHDGIIDALGEGFMNYTFIKPNEDCLAFHNGEGKVNIAFFVNWLLNNATSLLCRVHRERHGHHQVPPGAARQRGGCRSFARRRGGTAHVFAVASPRPRLLPPAFP